MSDNDKHIQKMFIAQCHICTLSPTMRHCKAKNGCIFNIGLNYWLCDGDRQKDKNKRHDPIRHKSELFCLRCDMERPKKLNPPPMSGEMIKAEMYLDSLYD